MVDLFDLKHIPADWVSQIREFLEQVRDDNGLDLLEQIGEECC